MKKEKFHDQMFRDGDGFPDNSSFLERGTHINGRGLKTRSKHKDLFTDKQLRYIDIHLESCPNCSERLNQIKSRENLNTETEEKELPF